MCDGTGKTQDVFYFKLNNNVFTIKHCVADNLLFLSPQPGPDFLNKLYNHSSYFTGEDDMYGLSVNDEKSAAIAKIRIDEVLEEKPGIKSFLEIGCGYGHTLVEAQNRGISEVTGIEFSEEAVNEGKKRGANILLGSANDIFPESVHDKKFDVIALYSVLEHLDNPKTFLKNIKNYLNKDGIVIVRVPRMSVDGPWLSLFDHMWHFTESALRALLSREGFTVEKVFPSGTFVGTKHPGELKSMTAVAKLA
jgi:SAM-dependent methyltransferase